MSNNASEPRVLSQHLLLFSKCHYGMWNRDNVLYYLAVIIKCVTLTEVSLDGFQVRRPTSQRARELFLRVVSQAMADYLPPAAAHTAYMEATLHYVDGQFAEGIACMLGHLGTLKMMDGEIELIALPERDEVAALAINDMRALLERQKAETEAALAALTAQ